MHRPTCQTVSAYLLDIVWYDQFNEKLLAFFEKGYLDDIPVNEISAFEAAFREHLKTAQGPLMKHIDETGAYDADVEAKLKAAVEEFKKIGSW